MRMTLVKTPEYIRDRNNKYYSLNKEKVNQQRKIRRQSDVRGRMLAIAGNAKARAKKNSFEYDISIDFLCDLWTKQKGLCALTGEELTLYKEDVRWTSSLVSLDRIDNFKGYTKDNIQLTTTKANFAKGTQSMEEFIAMCKKVMEKIG